MKVTSIAIMILTTFASSFNLLDVMQLEGPLHRTFLFLFRFKITTKCSNVTAHDGIEIRQTDNIT